MTCSDRAIVHIGYHKTASTWFQQHFYPLADNYRYVPREHFRAALTRAHAFAFDPQTACSCLGGNKELPPILCDEDLSGHFENGGHMGALSKELAERIQRMLPQAQIVVFIRHQVDIIAAAYAQYIKQGGTHGPRRFLFPAHYRKGPWRQPNKKPLFAFEHFDYIGLIRHYRALFGSDNVHVFAYEALRRNPRDFLQEFAARLSLTMDPERVDVSAVNTSYQHRTLALARVLNHLTYRDVVDKYYLIPIVKKYKTIRRVLERFNRTPFAGQRLSPEALLGDEIVAYIKGFYAAGNRTLAWETGLPLAEYGYPGVPGNEADI